VLAGRPAQRQHSMYEQKRDSLLIELSLFGPQIQGSETDFHTEYLQGLSVVTEHHVLECSFEDLSLNLSVVIKTRYLL
jgi:hypothetical protein